MQIKHLIILLTILVLVIQPVSATFFGGIFSEITGKVTENVEEISTEPEESVSPEESVPPVETEPEDSEPVPPVVPEPEDSMPAPPVMPEPVPPADVCSSVLKSQWCSEGEMLCPQKKDENGCVVWDCDSCEKCKPIQISQPSCPDGKTLCIEGKDERGCGIWDCSICEKPPEEECKEIAITMTCPDCEGLIEDCLCPMKKDEKGCLFWDCDSCETKPPIDIPDGCRKITLENGIEVIECEKECLAIPEDVKEKCKESGGNVIERTDHHGCPFIECEYEIEDPEKCPAHEVLETRKMACFNQGLEPMIVRDGECDTIKCIRVEPEPKCSEDVEQKKIVKEKCEESGGEIVKYFDNMGCPVTVCIHPELEECPKDIPQEAYKNCELEEGDLMVKRDSQGCLVFVDCIKRGKKEIEYEEVKEMPSAATLLSIALKLESLKIDFDKLATKVSLIAEYYENTGNKAEATKFRKVAGLFSGALDKIEGIKVKFRENAKDMTEEDLRALKYDIKYVSEVIIQDALYIILGGEIEVEGGSGVTEEGYTDCGSNDRCWEEAVRLCEPVVFKPKSGPNLIAKIHGFDNDVCIIEANGEGHSMLCKVPNYATISTNGPDILEFCEGSMVEWMKSGQKPAIKEESGEPGKCVDMCGDKICQGVVCMANGCPCPESPESCPRDCRAMPTTFKLCTEEDEKAWDICQNEGGNPQTDPSRYGNCEIYTHCTVPYSTITECEMISDIAIRNDCYIKIADMSGDSSVCEIITDPDRKNKCYVKAATTSGDRSVCENIIGDEDIKKHCYSSIAERHYKGEREIIKKLPEVEGEIVFTEDFEDGTENWIFYPAGDARSATGWGTAVVEGNTVLRGIDHNWVDLEVEQFSWTNYIFKVRFKIISGTMHFNYRLNKDDIFRRYYVGVSDHGMYLTRSTPPTHINLVDDVKIRLDDNWHTFKMVGYDNILNIYIDDELLIEYKDVGTPALPGGIAFETLGNGEFLIDDVEIQISGKKDVIGDVE